MKRRTLDILFSAGGLVLAGLLLILGVVLTSNASFARDYVRSQLDQQQITFAAVEKLTPEEAQVDCLVENAGKALKSGKQAECYANEFIGDHLKTQAKNGGYVGATYATLGTPQGALRTQVADMTKANPNDPKIAETQKKLDAVISLRDTMFKGETLRGLLLTSYGFSVFGDKGSLAATVCYIVAGLLALLSLAGFAHAFRTAPEVAVAPVPQLAGAY